MNRVMIGWQSLYFIAMYFGTFFSYLTPVLFLRRGPQSVSASISANNGLNSRQTERILSACNCFAAGVFLGICFLNLIPYVEQEFSELFIAAKYSVNFPVGQLTVILGLFLVLFLETIVMKCRNRSSPPVLHLDEEDFHDESLHEEQIQELLEVQNGDKQSDDGRSNHIHRHSNHSHQSHSHSHSHNINPNTSSTISFFILMFATSVHSVFEGLALGLQSDVTKALHLFIGIILHECLVAFALGLNSARIDCTLRTNIKFAVIFSATIPIGIVLGVGLGYTPGLLGHTISAIFQGLAAGTFIHVTFHELIPSEFMSDNESDSNSKLFKIFLLFIGFLAMALMTLLTDSH